MEDITFGDKVRYLYNDALTGVVYGETFYANGCHHYGVYDEQGELHWHDAADWVLVKKAVLKREEKQVVRYQMR